MSPTSYLAAPPRADFGTIGHRSPFVNNDYVCAHIQGIESFGLRAAMIFKTTGVAQSALAIESQAMQNLLQGASPWNGESRCFPLRPIKLGKVMSLS
jgi:hypothetical protein